MDVTIGVAEPREAGTAAPAERARPAGGGLAGELAASALLVLFFLVTLGLLVGGALGMLWLLG